MSTSESSLPCVKVSAPTADVPSEISIGSQIVKRKHGFVFRSLQKAMIANAHEFFDREKREQPIMVGNVVRRTSEALKVSESSICNVLKERRVEGDVTSFAKKGCKPSCGPTQQQTDNFLEGVICRRVHRFYTNGEIPTMDKLLLSLQDDVDYPYGRSTLLVQALYGLTLNKLQHKVSQLFPTQKSVLYNILKVLVNSLRGSERIISGSIQIT